MLRGQLPSWALSTKPPSPASPPGPPHGVGFDVTTSGPTSEGDVGQNAARLLSSSVTAVTKAASSPSGKEPPGSVTSITMPLL